MRDIVLIPGTWARSTSWGKLPQGLQDLGFRVHTPDLRYHELPYKEVEKLVGDISINDYVNDLVKYVESLGTDTIILGHSLGGLIAQLVAAKVERDGLILLGPAPSADIFALYPKMVHGFYKHFMRWGFWKKPMPPYKDTYFNYVTNLQTQETKEELFNNLVPESGKAYTEMSFPFFDKNKSTKVEYSKINCPVLVITGDKDLIVNPKIAKKTSEKYRDSRFVMLKNSDHMYSSDRVVDKTINEINLWLEEESLI